MNIRELLIKLYFCSLFVPLLNGIQQFNASSFLDQSFGNNGIVTTDFGMHSGTFNRYAASIHVKIQPDKKIIVVGDAYRNHTYDESKVGIINHPESNFALARYNSDGSLDNSFGVDGKVILPLSKVDSFGIDLALQDDGKIVVVGRNFDRGDYYPDAIMVRLNQDGTLDNSFGIGGIVHENNLENEVSQFWRVALQDDGKIIAVGSKGAYKQEYIFDYNSFFIARYTVDGTPDVSFGDNGKIETRLKVSNFAKSRVEGREDDYTNGLCLQSDGKILAVGAVADASTLDLLSNIYNADCALVRYEQSGKLDATFGQDKNGMIVTSASKQDNHFMDVVVQPDEKIVAIAIARNSATEKDEFLIARYLADGTLDASFGVNQNGLVLTSLGTDHAHAKNVLLQKDGKILVTGNVTWGSHTKFTLVRYTQDGILDKTFGQDGIIITFVGDGDDKSFAMAMQDDGKLVIAGNSFDGAQYNFALVRYNIQD